MLSYWPSVNRSISLVSSLTAFRASAKPFSALLAALADRQSCRCSSRRASILRCYECTCNMTLCRAISTGSLESLVVSIGVVGDPRIEHSQEDESCPPWSSEPGLGDFFRRLIHEPIRVARGKRRENESASPCVSFASQPTPQAIRGHVSPGPTRLTTRRNAHGTLDPEHETKHPSFATDFATGPSRAASVQATWIGAASNGSPYESRR